MHRTFLYPDQIFQPLFIDNLPIVRACLYATPIHIYVQIQVDWLLQKMAYLQPHQSMI